jgi:hypothetical protein
MGFRNVYEEISSDVDSGRPVKTRIEDVLFDARVTNSM